MLMVMMTFKVLIMDDEELVVLRGQRVVFRFALAVMYLDVRKLCVGNIVVTIATFWRLRLPLLANVSGQWFALSIGGEAVAPFLITVICICIRSLLATKSALL